MKTVLTSIIIAVFMSQMSFAQQSKTDSKKPIVTFIELGSVHCIPCQKMEVVLESIREKYPQDVRVIFHDVWTQAGKPFAHEFGVHSIPTQVFLDENGKEYYRHVGYFPEKDLQKVLKQKGVSK